MNFFTSFEIKGRVLSVALAVAAALLVPTPDGLCQQKPLSPEEQEEKLTEYIQSEVEKFENVLHLEDWQVFYVDSILTHDYHALQKEVDGFRGSKVTNVDIYTSAQDKWAEATYLAFKAILNDEQWARYLKTGAGREKKARDKRKAKLDGSVVK